jgi:hypothetical protein
MYGPKDIQSRLREKRFRPLRIIVSEGLQYDIHHLTWCWSEAEMS